jgi:hypothetical protein
MVNGHGIGSNRFRSAIRCRFAGDESQKRALDARQCADRPLDTKRPHAWTKKQWRTDVGDIERNETLHGTPVARTGMQAGGYLAAMKGRAVRPEMLRAFGE